MDDREVEFWYTVWRIIGVFRNALWKLKLEGKVAPDGKRVKA